MNESYVFLDSTRRTPQIIQHQVIKAFAINKNLNFLLGHDLILKSSNVTNIRHLAEVGFLLPSRSINAQSEIPLIGSVN